MTGNQTMDYYVWPQLLYSHSRTCIVVCVENFQLGGIPHLLPPWLCQCSWDFSSRDLIPVYVRYIQPLWRYWSFVYLHHGDFDLLYIVLGDDHTCHILYIMPIHGHCTLMYPGLLYVFAVICRDWLLYWWMAGSSTWFFITPLLGCIYNVFRPSCYPSYLTH